MAASETSDAGLAHAPLRRRMVEVPWLEPADAHALLRDHAPVLLDGSGAHPEARRAYLALSPAWQARCHHGRWTMHLDGRTHHLPGTPVAVLRRLCDGMFQDVEEEGFTGGLVGYFGYGFTHHLEPTLPPSPAATPEAVLWLCRDALVLDRGQRRAWLWTADLPGEDDAQARGARYRAILDRAARATSGHDQAEGRPAMVAPAEAPSPSTTMAPAPAPLASVARTTAPTTANAASSTGPPGMRAVAMPASDSGGALVAAHDPGADGAWETSMDESTFCRAVEALRRRVFEGDLFQANIATRFSVPCRTPPLELLRRLARDNPSPYMALVQAGDHDIVSCSPELLLRVEAGVIATRPIAGTRRRGAEPDDDRAMEEELLHDAKEQAEHTMLVDLLRNDVAKVAVPGSVHVPERMSIERYRHVMHLVSRVEGRVRPGSGFVDWLAALFPGGTITGAPKHRACLRIHQAEPVPRGPYTGSVGYLSWSHNAQWNILIRTIVLQEGTAHIHAGSGIVADSQPRREWREACRKARALLDAATAAANAGNDEPRPLGAGPPEGRAAAGADKGGPRAGAGSGGPGRGAAVGRKPDLGTDGGDGLGGAQAGGPGRLGEVTRHGRWQPPRPRQVVGRRVLLIDNFDSFTHNLADHVAAMGASVHVVRNDGDWQAALRDVRPTHVILSPGPGHPEASGATLALLRVQQDADAPKRLPILGVCLGHQAMALVTGGEVAQVPPVHGRADDVHHDGHGLLAGLPSPFAATRYHSLAATAVPSWTRIAWLADGTVMAMQHTSLPWWGLQFHPESLCTDVGVEILARFLEVEHGRHRVR